MKDTNYSNNSSSNASNASTSNNSNKMSFIDETKHVSRKVKVKKRNTDLNIKQSRLRKPLQNQNLLKNYFEFNKKELVTSDLTIYKIVEANNNDINGNEMDINSNNDVDDENNEIKSNKAGCRRPSVDQVVTTEKIKFNSQSNLNVNSNIMNELHNSTRVNNLIINQDDQNMNLNTNLNVTNTNQSNIDPNASATNSSNEEFDDSQSFLSSFSFLFN